jgi:thioredoxin-dependent peroxiredoxin
MKPGDLVEDFSALDQTGTTVRLTTLLESGPVVLFVYPRALTPGCTKQSCHFRDLSAEFASLGAQVVGLSADPIKRQSKFANKHSFGFPLLSDPDRAIAAALGVRRLGPLSNKRATFVIDTDRELLAIIESERDMEVHADDALEALRVRRTLASTDQRRTIRLEAVRPVIEEPIVLDQQQVQNPA